MELIPLQTHLAIGSWGSFLIIERPKSNTDINMHHFQCSDHYPHQHRTHFTFLLKEIGVDALFVDYTNTKKDIHPQQDPPASKGTTNIYGTSKKKKKKEELVVAIILFAAISE
jgi:hypothetical protein